MVQPDAVLEVPYRILDLGVAAMISLQFEGLPVPVGDEAVIAVGGEEGELGTGRGLHPSDDEPYRRGVRLGLEGGVELVSEVFSRTNIVIKTASNYGRLLVGNTMLSSLASIIRMSLWSWTSETSSVGGLGHIGGTVHPVRNRRPGIFGYRLDEIVQAFVLADGDGEADIHPAAGGDESVGVEAAVGPHGELPAAPGVANPAHRFTQEVGGAPGGVGPALAQPGHQHVAGSGGDGQQRVIAPLAGIAVVAGALLGQSVAELCPYPARAEATNWVSPPQRPRRDTSS